MAEVTKKVLIREIVEPTQRMTFKKATEDDVLTFEDSVHYVEASQDNITVVIPGIENISVEVAGVPETWEYANLTMSANQTSSSNNKRDVVVAAADFANFTAGVFYRNEMSGEYFEVLGKTSATNTIHCMRGVYGTTPVDFAKDDVITQFNKIVLTSENVGHGTLICSVMPTPGYAQNYAQN